MTNAIRKMKNNKKGFTLVELLVVIVILGILATLAIMSFAGRTDEAKINKAKGDLRTVMSALELYRMDEGAYPLSENASDSVLSVLTTNKYMKTLPKVYSYTRAAANTDYTLTVGTGLASPSSVSVDDL